MGAFMVEFNKDLAGTGKLVGTRGLTAPCTRGGSS